MTYNETMKNALIVLLAAGILAAAAAGSGAQVPPPSASGQARATAFIVSDVDLHCSFFVLADVPALKISGGDGARTLYSDGDRVLLAGQGLDALREGQVFSVLELGPKIASQSKKPSPGRIAFQRGRVRILGLQGAQATAQVERACAPIMAGHVLVPFLEKAKMTVADFGLEPGVPVPDMPAGKILYLEDDAVQVATGQRALIDLGRADGIEPGRRMTVFFQAGADQPFTASANAVVIDAGPASATVKILTAKTPVRVGDLVQAR
jgi:hypothetical protein